MAAHSTDEGTSSALIYGERYTLESSLRRLRVPERHVLAVDQAPCSTQLLRTMNGDLDLSFAFLYGNLASISEVITCKVSVEFEASAFSARFGTPTFVQPG